MEANASSQERNAFVLRTSLICATIFLTCLGLLAIYASSSIPAAQKYMDSFFYVRKQGAVAAFGFLMIFLFRFVPISWIARLTLPAVVGAVVLMAMIFLPGLGGKSGGAMRWLNLFGFRFQPGEIAKLALVLFLARNLSRPKCDAENLVWGVGPNLMLFGLFALLLMLQPDFGTTFLLLILTFVMLFAAGVTRPFIVTSSVLATGAIALAIAQAPYRLSRLVTFLDPWSAIKDGGFQLIQSYLAFQNGGLLGAGLGESRQKLFFLPEAHTDFILSVIGEELGLLGVLLVCFLFVYVVYLGFRITLAQQTEYRRFLAFGLTFLIASQAVINIGVTMGLLPTKGIPLPFVSSGSSSLIVFLAVVAILARLSQDRGDAKDAS